MEEKKREPIISNENLRIIGISLAVLSIGLAIAYGGLIYYSKHKPINNDQPSIATPSSHLK